MASIYKRKQDRGKKRQPWYIGITDENGKRRTLKGFADKAKSEQFAAKIEHEMDLRRRGLIDPELDRAAERRKVPIEQHAKAYERSLANNSPRYIKLVIGRVLRIIAGCGFETMADVSEEAINDFLQKLAKEEGIGHRTNNHYRQAFYSFCQWSVRTKRIAANPVAGLERLNNEVDVRHPRRALTSNEVARLIESARKSGKKIQCFDGETRARIYQISVMTGLRRNEIASLTPRSFSLDSDPPTVTVEAAFSKHRRRDVLPLHPELVRMLRFWLAGMEPDQILFPKLEGRRTWLMVKKDLARIGIPYETPEGIADFHAAGRHTHITELLRNGATLPEAKELARHTDVKMTMRYTHIGIEDQARALRQLPWDRGQEGEGNRPHGTEQASESQSGWECSGSDSADSPCHNKAAGDSEAKNEDTTKSDVTEMRDRGCRVPSPRVASPSKRRNGFDSRRLHSTPPMTGGVFLCQLVNSQHVATKATQPPQCHWMLHFDRRRHLRHSQNAPSHCRQSACWERRNPPFRHRPGVRSAPSSRCLRRASDAPPVLGRPAQCACNASSSARRCGERAASPPSMSRHSATAK